VIFHSLDFAIFFVLLVPVYWTLRRRGQNVLLLAASYLFYGWVHPWFAALIAATTLVDYGAALGIDRRPARRKAFLWMALVVNLGLLGFFKYFNFFADNVAAALAAAGWQVSRPALAVALPVGISFYTFQGLSYVIDVYWARTPARKSLLDIAAFIAFFPSLLAGPIMRASTLLPQIERARRFSAAAARDASLLLAWGFFKKLVIADNVGVHANKVFALQSPEFFVLWAGVFAFGIQIYADFSAYADIARGVAAWLGIDLMKNFEHPYLAKGPTEFWRRWNISLSTWFRDYVFLPVAYGLSDRMASDRRVVFDAATWAYVGGMIITMLTAGLWHGASWNFVIWGAYHGVLLALARIIGFARRRRRRVRRWLAPLQVAGMFVLTNLGWLFFRETDLAQLVRHLGLSPFESSVLGRQTGAYLFFLAWLYSMPLWIQSVWAEFGGRDFTAAMTRREDGLEAWTVAVQALLAGLLFAGILVLHSTTSLDFIYFRF
jgi:D-alanyl-lipoteichoic acid acyltransferase DltB (MBOAT superfamily)